MSELLGTCGHAISICPNGDGDAFACNSFCALCEGGGDYCTTCDGKPIAKCECERPEAPGWHVGDMAGITFGGLKRAQNEAANNMASYIAHIFITKPDAVFSSFMHEILDGENKHEFIAPEVCEWRRNAG